MIDAALLHALYSFAIALFFTILIECGLIRLIKRDRYSVWIVLWCNVLTNPLLNLLLLLGTIAFGEVSRWALIAILECVVVFVEAFIFDQLLTQNKKEALYLSIKLNASSFVFGLLLATLIRFRPL